MESIIILVSRVAVGLNEVLDVRWLGQGLGQWTHLVRVSDCCLIQTSVWGILVIFCLAHRKASLENGLVVCNRNL